MSTIQTEYDAVSKIAKTERQYRFVIYIIGAVVLASFLLFAYQLYASEQKRQQETQKILQEIKDITALRLKATEEQNNQTRRYITCLLVLPIPERTIEAQQRCLQESISGTDIFSTLNTQMESEALAEVAEGSSSNRDSVDSSYPNTTPQQTATQQNISQNPQVTSEPAVQPASPPSLLDSAVSFIVGIPRAITNALGDI